MNTRERQVQIRPEIIQHSDDKDVTGFVTDIKVP